MNAIQATIKDYVVSQSDTCYLRAFVGMIETGEATYSDFEAVGGERLRDTVRKTKEKWDAERTDNLNHGSETMKLDIRNGFAHITVGEITVVAPADDYAGGDERLEIRLGDQRVFVEASDDGLSISAVERFT